MNTKCIVLIACFLFPLLSRSQDHAIKINFGVVRSSIIYEPEINNELKTGINIDFNYNRKISRYFFISGGLGFIQNGDISDIFLTSESGESLGVEELKREFEYVNMSTCQFILELTMVKIFTFSPTWVSHPLFS